MSQTLETLLGADMRIRPQNTSWLAVIGAMVGLAAIAPNVDPAAALGLLGIFGAAAAASLIEFRPARLVERSRSSLTALRMSAEAREAVDRARRRGSALHSVMLLDVGLISALSGRDGLIMQRTRDLSKDDDGARPFAVLSVPAQEADRQAIIRFEFIDASGRPQYVHEMKTYLRDGEMNLLPDQQMPLYGSEAISPGQWDLRIYVDNRLIGAHPFTVAPSVEDRFPAAARERAERRLRDQAGEEPDSGPLRLEDLLRQQAQQSRDRRGG